MTANLVNYSVFSGAGKLVCWFCSKGLRSMHYEISKDVSAADFKYPPRDQLDRLRELLCPGIWEWLLNLPPGILTAGRQPRLLDARQRCQLNSLGTPSTQPHDAAAELRTLLTVALEDIMLKPGDEPDVYLAILVKFHLSIVDCLKNLNGAMPSLRNLLNKFMLKRQALTEDMLRATLEKVCGTLVPLEELTWHWELFEWYISVYLATKLLSEAASESALEVTEDEGDEFTVPEKSYSRQSASEHAEAYRNPLKDREDASKEWVYWLRQVTAPLYYSFMVHGYRDREGKRVRLAFQVVDCPPVLLQMKPWCQVVKDLFTEQCEQCIIIDELSRRFGSGTSNVISDPSFTFKGCVHREAMLASLRHAAALRHAPAKDKVQIAV